MLQIENYNNSNKTKAIYLCILISGVKHKSILKQTSRLVKTCLSYEWSETEQNITISVFE